MGKGHANGFAFWWEINILVGSWILNTIEPTLRTSLNYLNGQMNCEKIWRSVSCGKTYLENMSLRSPWQIANKVEIQWACTSGGNCSTAAVVIKERDEEKVYQFFMGLNDAIFGTVWLSIIKEELVPKIKLVYAKITKASNTGCY